MFLLPSSLFPKQYIVIAVCLYSTYIVLGLISNLEMIKRILENS